MGVASVAWEHLALFFNHGFASVLSLHYGTSQNDKAKLDLDAQFLFEIFLKDTILAMSLARSSKVNPVETMIPGDDQLADDGRSRTTGKTMYEQGAADIG